mmetsp:Transcript_544/g.1327  ORF Transcript_544/g.1327 Transcript_544/m.1327 type:complete len:211 (-) Transcript_544:919-1551(-)
MCSARCGSRCQRWEAARSSCQPGRSPGGSSSLPSRSCPADGPQSWRASRARSFTSSPSSSPPLPPPSTAKLPTSSASAAPMAAGSRCSLPCSLHRHPTSSPPLPLLPPPPPSRSSTSASSPGTREISCNGTSAAPWRRSLATATPGASSQSTASPARPRRRSSSSSSTGSQLLTTSTSAPASATSGRAESGSLRSSAWPSAEPACRMLVE